MKTPNQLQEQFGRYRIIKRLGQGGMGAVYLAQDTHLGRAVALKVPDFGQHEAPEARRRFLEEARTAATLRHPYLCQVYDAGEIEGQPYLTMAYIEGQSLAALIGEEGWPERQVAALVGKLAIALQEAHAQKVIHRDLKPANVMIKKTGGRREPVIVDFGLAHRDNPDGQRLTRSGQIMGTLTYMAPEQIRGDLNAIGPACDIYALGVILYELLTGRLPFSGSGLAVAGKILTQTPLPPSTHRSDLDPALEAICLKAMAKAVGDRYASMAELAAALTGFLQSPSATPTPTTPVDSPGSPSPESDERPKRAGSSSLVGRFLAQLAGSEESPSPIPTPEPVASRAMLPERWRPRWPMIVAAGALGVLLLGVIIFMNRRTGRVGSGVTGGSVAKRPSTKPAAKGQEGRVEEPGVNAADMPKPQPMAPNTPPKLITNSVGMKLVLIPAGTFLMGSPDEDKDAKGDEKPQHPVRITRSFYLGVTEVTRGEFRRFVDDAGYWTEPEKDGKGGLGYNEKTKKWVQSPQYTWQSPGFEQTEEHPAVNVSWNDTVAFAQWLSRKEGKSYRLPTEAEWVYACRAGTATRFSNGDDQKGLAAVGNVRDRTAKEKNPNWSATLAVRDGYVYTAPVGRFQANAFGLYDMHGNAGEWCSDGYAADYYQQSPVDDPPGAPGASHRVLQGGCWFWIGQNCRTATRWEWPPGARYSHLGFRVALVPSAPSAAMDPGTVPGTAGSIEGSSQGRLAARAPDNRARIPPEKPSEPSGVHSRLRSDPTVPLTEVTNGIGMKLVLIPAGTFLMGSPDGEGDTDERPQHEVRITRPFYVGVTEVTRGQFRLFVDESGYKTETEKDGKGGWGWNEETKKFEQSPKYTWENPGFEQTVEHPVVNVSWKDAREFAAWLSQKELKSYRLPSEAEREYACRAGTKTPYFSGIDVEALVAFGNIADGTAKEKYRGWTTTAARDGYVYTAPVGRFRANAFGLYDMHGNVSEWCQDWYDAGYYKRSPVDDPPGPAQASARVRRGGSWHGFPSYCRSADRAGFAPAGRGCDLGFRLAIGPSGP